MSFLPAAFEIVSALSAANQADAKRKYADALKDASEEDLPPAWKEALQQFTQQSAADEAQFQKSIDDQQKVLKYALIAGGVLLAAYLFYELV